MNMIIIRGNTFS